MSEKSTRGYPWGTPGKVFQLGSSQVKFLWILNPSWDPSWGLSSVQLRALGASWRVLVPPRAVFVWSGGPFFPIFFFAFFHIKKNIVFWSILMSKTTSKSIKNPWKNYARNKVPKTSFFCFSFIVFWRSAKKADLQKLCKNTVFFCIFLISAKVLVA